MPPAPDQLLLAIIAPDKRDAQFIGGGDGPLSFPITMQEMQSEQWVPLVVIEQVERTGEAPSLRRREFIADQGIRRIHS
jgi:hypothetical protein